MAAPTLDPALHHQLADIVGAPHVIVDPDIVAALRRQCSARSVPEWRRADASWKLLAYLRLAELLMERAT